MLPIVQRDLRVTARNPKLYARRVRWGVLQVIVALGVLLVSGGSFQRGAAQSLFSTLCNLALIFCLLEGVRKASDAISSEKREGTLGFLFFSTLSGADVALGKFCGALIRSLSVLLPFLPILSLSLLVGGTTFGEFWRMALVLIATLVLSLALCLFISSVTREESIGASLIALAIVCFIPFSANLASMRFHWLALLSPFEFLRAAKDPSYTRTPSDFAIGTGLALAGAAIWLAGASFFVTRTWQQRAILAPREAPVRQNRSKRRRKLLEKNPVLWLHYNPRRSTFFSLFAIGCLAVGLLGLWGALVPDEREAWSSLSTIAGTALAAAIWFRVATQASTGLAESRRDGSLALLLTTPLSVDEVMRGYILALWRTVRVPVLCFTPFWVALIIASDSPFWTFTCVLGLPLALLALGSLGIWMGLISKSRGGAVIATVVLGSLAPSMLCCLLYPGQIGLILGAFYKSKEILNRMRTGGEPRELGSYLRVPGTVDRGVPPVIRHAAPPVIK